MGTGFKFYLQTFFFYMKKDEFPLILTIFIL